MRKILSHSIVMPLLSLLLLCNKAQGEVIPTFATSTELLYSLHSVITIIPTEASKETPLQIQPGSQVKFSARVTNNAIHPQAAGNILIRFAFLPPLDVRPHSLLFQTEKVALPALQPGESIVIAFATPHKLPSLFDFIREDWAMRHYQAVITIEGVEKITGTLALLFSAYYYPGPAN